MVLSEEVVLGLFENNEFSSQVSASEFPEKSSSGRNQLVGLSGMNLENEDACMLRGRVEKPIGKITVQSDERSGFFSGQCQNLAVLNSRGNAHDIVSGFREVFEKLNGNVLVQQKLHLRWSEGKGFVRQTRAEKPDEERPGYDQRSKKDTIEESFPDFLPLPITPGQWRPGCAFLGSRAFRGRSPVEQKCSLKFPWRSKNTTRVAEAVNRQGFYSAFGRSAARKSPRGFLCHVSDPFI